MNFILRAITALTRLLSISAYAQGTYPAKPIRFIAPFAPGGIADTLSRLISQKLSESLGQSVLVENRGCRGQRGNGGGCKKYPDGYTIGPGSISTHAINLALVPRMSYDAMTDFAPITVVANNYNLLVANPSVPAKDVRELVALAKSRPGELSYGSAGIGTAAHLAGKMFNSMAGVSITHVPYRGAALGMSALIGGGRFS